MGNNRTMRNSKVDELSSTFPSVKTNNNEYLLLHCASGFTVLAEAWE